MITLPEDSPVPFTTIQIANPVNLLYSWVETVPSTK